jgi:hypothetical protein
VTLIEFDHHARGEVGEVLHQKAGLREALLDPRDLLQRQIRPVAREANQDPGPCAEVRRRVDVADRVRLAEPRGDPLLELDELTQAGQRARAE